MLTRAQILASDDILKEEVNVPEWGGHVFVRVMSGTLRDRLEGAASKDRFSNFRARLVAYTVCDELGVLLFNEADIVALGHKSAAAMERVFPVATRLNGMTKDEVEALEKNSEPSPSFDSAYGPQHILA